MTILDRLDDTLQKSEEIPEVHNPALWDELFSRRWDQASYSHLRDHVSLYRQWIDDAFAEEDRLSSVVKWRRVFGDSFAAGVEIPSKVIESAQLPTARHEQEPRWPARISERVDVDATVYDAGRMRGLGGLNSGGRGLAKGLSLKFVARTTAAPPFDVMWQVVNTGPEARAANQLRGDFYESETSMTRWESTRYCGCHWVRCFLIRDGVCIAASSRFVIRIS